MIREYSPLDEGRVVHAARSKRGSALAKAAGRHGVSPAAVALAWTIRDEGILRELDRDFPPPERDLPLEMI